MSYIWDFGERWCDGRRTDNGLHWCRSPDKLTTFNTSVSESCRWCYVNTKSFSTWESRWTVRAWTCSRNYVLKGNGDAFKSYADTFLYFYLWGVQYKTTLKDFNTSFITISLLTILHNTDVYHLFAFVAISKVTTSRLPPCCFGRWFTEFLEAKASYSCWIWPTLLHVKLVYPFYFRIFGSTRIYPLWSSRWKPLN